MSRKGATLPSLVAATGLLALSACAVAAEPPTPPANPDQAFADALGAPAPVPAPPAPSASAAGTPDGKETVVTITSDGETQHLTLDGGTMLFIDGSGKVHKLGKGRHRFRYRMAGEGEAESDVDVDIELDDDREAADAGDDHKTRIIRRLDGDRAIIRLDGDQAIIIEMDGIKRAVEQAKERAKHMQSLALRHLDRAMENAEHYAESFDVERYRDQMMRAGDALKRAEEQMRRAFDRSWDEALSAELDELAEELARLQGQKTELAELGEAERKKVIEARRKALEAARQEIEKAESIRREALAQAAEQVRAARKELRQRREALERALEAERQGDEDKNKDDNKDKGGR